MGNRTVSDGGTRILYVLLALTLVASLIQVVSIAPAHASPAISVRLRCRGQAPPFSKVRTASGTPRTSTAPGMSMVAGMRSCQWPLSPTVDLPPPSRLGGS